MVHDICHNCGNKERNGTNTCLKCGASDSINKSGDSNLVFGGTILLLLAIGLVSYPYLINDSSSDKYHNTEAAVDSLSNKEIKKIDTLIEDSVNKIPSF